MDVVLRNKVKLLNGVKVKKVNPHRTPHSLHSFLQQHMCACVPSQNFLNHGNCTGKVVGNRLVDSTIYLSTKRKAWRVRYDKDNQEQESEEEDIRTIIDLCDSPDRGSIIAGIKPAFDHLKSRLTGTRETSNYSSSTCIRYASHPVHNTLQHMPIIIGLLPPCPLPSPQVCKVARMLDPSCIKSHLVPNMVKGSFMCLRTICKLRSCYASTNVI
ncbi:MAG: hypothetical protein SGPRY_005437 [Prymnesium sp.]